MIYPLRGSLFAAALSIGLSACGTPPSRDEKPSQFALVAKAQILQSQRLGFMDCIQDGFARVSRYSTAFSVRRVSRKSEDRIEIISSNVIQSVSVDFLSNGEVLMYARPDHLGLLNGAKPEFAACFPSATVVEAATAP